MLYKFGFVEQILNYYCRGRRPRRPVRNVQNVGQMISAPTNLISINCVGTGVLDRPLTQQNLRTVREAGPYEHRVRLCKIKEPDKPEFVGVPTLRIQLMWYIIKNGLPEYSSPFKFNM